MSHSFTESLAGGNFSNGKAALAAGTTTTYSVGAFNYTIEGRQYAKAASTNQASPVVDGATNKAFNPVGPNKACNFVFGIDAAGAVVVWQGPVVDASDATDFPALPFTHAPFGYIRVSTNNAASFQFGATNLSGVTGVTYSFRDIAGMPARPVV